MRLAKPRRNRKPAPITIKQVGDHNTTVVPADHFPPPIRHTYSLGMRLEWLVPRDMLSEQELLALRPGAAVALGDDIHDLIWFVRDVDGRAREMEVATLVVATPQQRTVSFDLVQPLQDLPSDVHADANRAWSLICTRLGSVVFDR
jgi:hypothetical protein